MSTEPKELYEKLISGQTSDVNPQSRVEEHLLYMMQNGIGDGFESSIEPRSRVEAYLLAIIKMGIAGSGSVPGGSGEACNVPKPTTNDNGKILQVVNGKAAYVAVENSAIKAHVENAIKDMATQSDIENAIKDMATQSDIENAIKDMATQSDIENAITAALGVIENGTY